MIYLYLTIVCVVGYLLGGISFARIFSLLIAKKDITTVGSKNPGTMNVLRTRGIGEAFLTLLFEAVKVGVPALACFYLFRHFYPGYENFAYFLGSMCGVVGHCFPVYYKFKGGKGVACAFGMFVFHPNFWWVSLIVFAICFVLFLFIQYPFIISFTFIFTLTIYSTCIFVLKSIPFWPQLVFIVWVIAALIVFMHRSNIKRLIEGHENKVNFREKLFKRKKTDKSEETKEDDKKVDEKNEKVQKSC